MEKIFTTKEKVILNQLLAYTINRKNESLKNDFFLKINVKDKVTFEELEKLSSKIMRS